jgi:hypothetical protein
MWKKIEQVSLQSKISDFLTKKPLYSNYFGVKLDDVEHIEYPQTLVIRKPFETFTRIYYLSNNADELVKILKKMSRDDIINIPSRGKDLPNSMKDVLFSSGYYLYATYVRLYNHHIKAQKEFIESFANINDLETMYEMLYEHFIPFADHLPTRSELVDMVNNKQILVNRDNYGKVTGLLGFERNKNYWYCSLLLDKSGGANGLMLIFKLYIHMAANNVERLYCWVRNTNETMLKIYKVLKYQLDGLKDYIFVKVIE